MDGTDTSAGSPRADEVHAIGRERNLRVSFVGAGQHAIFGGVVAIVAHGTSDDGKPSRAEWIIVGELCPAQEVINDALPVGAGLALNRAVAESKSVEAFEEFDIDVQD
jgi:hypothetical protein